MVGASGKKYDWPSRPMALCSACGFMPQRKWLDGKVRATVFIRDSGECVYCGSSEKVTIDHVLPQSRGGTNDPNNLVTACSSCNFKKGDKELLPYQKRERFRFGRFRSGEGRTVAA